MGLMPLKPLTYDRALTHLWSLWTKRGEQLRAAFDVEPGEYT